MKKNTFAFLFLFYILLSLKLFAIDSIVEALRLEEKEALIVIDQTEPLDEFRIINDKSDTLKGLNEEELKGLSHLKLSGSAQFSLEGLSDLISHLDQKKLLLIDLREEPHGFINGLPISWMLKDGSWPSNDLTDKEVEEDEKELLKSAQKEKNIKIYKVHKIRSEDDDVFKDKFIPKDIEVLEVSTERNQAAKLNIAYLRVPVTDHDRPHDMDVDIFVTNYTSKPEDTWTHIHCRGGRGRTTTFIIMVDMLENAKLLSFEEIMKREMLLNRTNFFEPTTIVQKRYKTQFFSRLEFLKKFYVYCRENKDGYQTSWSSWLAPNESQSSILNSDLTPK